MSYRLILKIAILAFLGVTSRAWARDDRDHYHSIVKIHKTNSALSVSIKGMRSSILSLKLKRSILRGSSYAVDQNGKRVKLSISPKFYRGEIKRTKKRAALTEFSSGDIHLSFYDGRFFYTALLKKGAKEAKLKRAPRSIKPLCGDPTMPALVSGQGGGDEGLTTLPASAYGKVLAIKTIADNVLYKQNGSNASQTNEAILALVNSAQASYDPLDIELYVMIQEVYKKNLFGASNDSSELLSRMGQFPLDLSDVVIGFFGRDFDGSIVGLAYVGVLCSAAHVSYAVIQANQGYFSELSLAHELGHNFGAGHVANVSDADRSLMNATLTSATPRDFSAASLAEIDLYLSVSNQCLLDDPTDGGAGNAPATQLKTKVSSKNGTFSIVVRNSSTDLYCTHSVYGALKWKLLVPAISSKATLLKQVIGNGNNRTFKAAGLGVNVRKDPKKKAQYVYLRDMYTCGSEVSLSAVRAHKLNPSSSAPLTASKWLARLKKILS